MTPDLLTLRVDFRDPEAAARILPAQANAYLAAHGWRNVLDTEHLRVWDRGPDKLDQVVVPRSTEWGSDYGAAMVRVLATVAEQEDRGVLAVYVEMAETACAEGNGG